MHHAEAQQMRSKSQTMANFMAIANKYATANSAMQKLIRLLSKPTMFPRMSQLGGI
jgi:hypothetical protein